VLTGMFAGDAGIRARLGKATALCVHARIALALRAAGLTDVRVCEAEAGAIVAQLPDAPRRFDPIGRAQTGAPGIS